MKPIISNPTEEVKRWLIIIVLALLSLTVLF
jgi:hypothetical protein